MKNQVSAAAAELLTELIEIRRYLHQYPEPSFKEFETAKFVEAKLGEWGIASQRMAETGVVCEIKGSSPGPTIALRADLDALPILEQTDASYASKNEGWMHACGHDVHTTSLLGAVKLLQQFKGEVKGTVRCIFQPGEERLPGGASIMIKEGVLENPKVQRIFGQHVYPELEAGKVGFCPGQYMASADEIHATVHGRGGHAAMPHRNIDPVLIASHTIVGLQQVVSRRCDPRMPSVLSFGRFVANGATNVIPDSVELKGTFRTFDEAWRMEAHEIIANTARGIADSMGGRCEIEIRKGYPFVNNDPSLTDWAMQCARSYLGEEQVVQLEQRMTGEDFAFYSQQIPGTFYRLGTGNEALGIIHPVHNNKFDIDEKALEIGAGLMCWLAIEQLKFLAK